jgi:hypothetical protein
MGKTIKMGKKEYLNEHRELVKTLRNPTKKRLTKEAQDQSKEIRKSLGLII